MPMELPIEMVYFPDAKAPGRGFPPWAVRIIQSVNWFRVVFFPVLRTPGWGFLTGLVNYYSLILLYTRNGILTTKNNFILSLLHVSFFPRHIRTARWEKAVNWTASENRESESFLRNIRNPGVDITPLSGSLPIKRVVWWRCWDAGNAPVRYTMGRIKRNPETLGPGVSC